ncbi:hypothetical protein COCOBI_02-8870 [Coccomyxa sp. Obi]|nr:hypothetical protein COCOBI_02-8870 [Coccomyxa sp. Obi]
MPRCSADCAAQEFPNILQIGQDTLGSLTNDTVHHNLLDTLASNAVDDGTNGFLSESIAGIKAIFHPTPSVQPQTTLPSKDTTMPLVMTSTPLPSTLPPSTPPQTSTRPQTATVPPSGTPIAMTSTPLQTTTVIPSTVSAPTPTATATHPGTSALPSTTPSPTTPLPSSTPGTCQDVIGTNACYINATISTATTNTYADLCADPVTCQCTTTSTDTVCTNSTGLCVDTATNFKQCGLYQSCATAPVTLGFEDATLGAQSNPFNYGDLIFTASGSGGSQTLVIVNRTTEDFPEINFGEQALEGTYSIPAGGSLQSYLSIEAPGSPIVAVSAYINGRSPSGLAGIDLDFTLSYNSSVQPDCISSTVSTPGPNGAPVKVCFGSAALWTSLAWELTTKILVQAQMMMTYQLTIWLCAI